MSNVKLELDDNLITVDSSGDKSIEFDSKGTLHITSRDEDGKILNRKSLIKTYIGSTDYYEEDTKRLEELKARNKELNGMYKLIIGVLVLFISSVIITVLLA